MSELGVAIIFGFFGLVLGLKILKLAIRMAFLLALAAGLFAGYLAYAGSDTNAATLVDPVRAVVGW